MTTCYHRRSVQPESISQIDPVPVTTSNVLVRGRVRLADTDALSLAVDRQR